MKTFSVDKLDIEFFADFLCLLFLFFANFAAD